MKTLKVLIEEDHYKYIKKLAKVKKVSMAEVTRVILHHYIYKKEK